MKKIKIKTPAKLNLTLDVTGVQDGFHTLESLVCSISVCDTITLKKRSDDKITLKQKGLDCQCDITENNAYRSAKLFMQTFKTTGVDIIINKKIPVGGGLGGSSANASGVLNGMKRLYEVETDLSPLANKLGSDTAYMLSGGYAVLRGRGEQVELLNLDKRLYLLILTCDKGVLAKESYKKFDELSKSYPPATKTALEFLTVGKDSEFLQTLKNDLYHSSAVIQPKIKSNLSVLKQFGNAVMTGSGSTVVGVYTDKKIRDSAYRKLKPILKARLLKATTL